MAKFEFAELHLRNEDWMVRQYMMHTHFPGSYAGEARVKVDIGW